MNATPEEWRPIVGYEGYYQVSSHGRVRSLDRTITFPDGRSRLARGRILKPWMSNRGGYPVVGLKRAGESRKVMVHVLVLEAFVGPRPDGYACCHGDGDPHNNHVSNLRWDTYSANNYDLVEHGTHHNASKTHCPRDHEYTPENTRLYTHRGWQLRYCRACEKINNREAKARLKAQRPADWVPRKSGAAPGTHCGRGHEFTPENTYIRPDGRRSCKGCQRIRGRGQK